MNDHKHEIWGFVTLGIVLIICVTLIILAFHPFVIRFEMDNNTLEAIKSINYTSLSNLTRG